MRLLYEIDGYSIGFPATARIIMALFAAMRNRGGWFGMVCHFQRVEYGSHTAFINMSFFQTRWLLPRSHKSDINPVDKCIGKNVFGEKV